MKAFSLEGRAALVTFVMAGDPDAKTSAEIIAALPAAGADLIEIGMPFTDPMADGPTVQLAGKRGLAAGVKTRFILDMVREFRKDDQATPIVLMGYYNPIYRYGVERFVTDARAAGGGRVDHAGPADRHGEPHAALAHLARELPVR